MPGDALEWARTGAPERMPFPAPSGVKSSSRNRKRRSQLPSIHPLLDGLEDRLQNAGTSYDGYLKPRKGLIVDLTVSREALPRIVEVANELFLSLEARD